MKQLSYEEAAKTIRNRLRRYSVVSIVRRALESIQAARNGSALAQLQTLPWVSFLIVKLMLEDQMTSISSGEDCPKNIFDQCHQGLWDVSRVPDPDDEKSNIYLMLRSLVPVQLNFQKKISLEFLRWPALIARLDLTHPTRLQFVERLGMQPDVFICICYAAYAPVVGGEIEFKREYFTPLMQNFGNAVGRFLDEFSRDLSGLRAELRCQLAARIASKHPARPRNELSEFPWLSKYPLLRDGEQALVVWHPLVFSRGMEDGVHKRLSETKGEYTNHFSKVFESYVLELVEGAGLTYLSEQAYKKSIGEDEDAVEAIITYAGVNVFIESKLTVYSDNLILSDRKPMVWTKLKRVREAMHQGWKVSTRLRGGNLPTDCASANEDFLVVVTSQQIGCATGEHFLRMFKQDVFYPSRSEELNATFPTTEQLEMLPLKNIMIVSIGEFEHLMGCVLNGEIDLVTFLREVADAQADPKTTVMFIDQLLGSKTKQWALPKVIEQASLRAEETLKGMLGSIP